MKWDSLPSTNVNSWSNSIRTITCSWEADSKLGMYSMLLNTIFLSYKRLQLRFSTHQKRVTHYLFLQYSGPRPWYVLLHSTNDVENDLHCAVIKYGRPEGNTSLITIKVYSNRWVHNVHCLFAAVLSQQMDIIHKTGLLFTELCGRYWMWWYIGVGL